jgi:tetratricopeptide (TPR) repeat protein
MTTSDWITLLGAIVAAIAVVVSAAIALIAVKVQRNQAEIQRSQAETERQKDQEDTKKDLAEVAQTLASKIAQLYMLPAMGPEAAAASSEVTGLVIRANELADVSSSVTWYVYYSLAMAYGWLWETSKAAANWEKALDHADTAHNQVLVLIGEAAFQYTAGSIEAGRGCFDKAEEILKSGFSGDLLADQLSYVLAQRASLEYGAGERSDSASTYVKAWQQCQAITTAWRKTRASWAVGNAFLQTFLQTFWQEQTRPPDTIPADLVAFSISLSQQQTQQASAFGQQAANAQQSLIQQSPILQDGASLAANDQSASSS